MRLLKILLALIVLAAVAAGGAFLYFQRALHTKGGGGDEPLELKVPKGASAREVGRLLVEGGFIESELVWRLHGRLNRPPAPKAGRHRITKDMSVVELAAALAETPLSDDVPLTLVEGWRLSDADEFLARQGLAPAGAYLAAAARSADFKLPPGFGGESLEGWLLPETYLVPPGPVDVKSLIQRQLDKFQERFAGPYAEEIKKSGRSLSDLVILASMLEREEPLPAQRPAVAGVLYKRLDAGTPLGVDATSRYLLADWNDRPSFLKALRDPTDRYNTRERAGLPPTAIGAASVDSLVAALRPVPGPYWYYLHDANRTIHFARTAEEHEANRKRYNVY